MDRGRETADFGGVTLDGRYRLGERRADGAHDGVHLPTGRRVVVRQAPGGTAEAMRLKRVLQRIVALDHPAVVPVLDAGTGESGLYLVEARVDGESLAELMGQPQPADRVADLVRQLARVLAEAHGRGLIHGALRPDSVIIQQTTGRSDYVRLTGIGLGDTPFSLGAGPWVAPEQRDGQPADARSDLYTLGLMGRALLGGLSPAEAAAGPLPGAPPKLLEVLDAICRRSPAQRPPSAVAVLGPIERATTVGRSGGGRRAMADTFVATGPLPDVGPSGTLLEGRSLPPAPVYGAPPIDARPIDAPPLHEPLTPPARRPWIWLVLVAGLVGVIVYLLTRGPADPPGDTTAQIEAAAAPVEAPAAAPIADAAPAPDAASPDAAPPDAAAADAAVEAPPIERPVRRLRPRRRPPPVAPTAPEPEAPVERPTAPPPTPPKNPADYEKL